jgi:hypothetical protein
VVIIGLWLALIGYGVAYAGQAKLAGKACTLQQAFSGGGCTAAAPKTTSAAPGQTAGQSASSLLAQQRAAVPTVPVMSA